MLKFRLRLWLRHPLEVAYNAPPGP